MQVPDAIGIVKPLLGWYDKHRRALPWRAPPGRRSDPYRVWLSEIMLQQTTVPTVGKRFARFLKRWPGLGDLAAADLDEVLHEWQGLGYYARARNLLACARAVMRDHGGKFPEDEAALGALPGIGDYTAAAIAAIAFGRKATVVDGNVERVVARLYAIATPLPRAKAEIRIKAALLTPERRPGDFAQAMMDLGATICVPGKPRCDVCPVSRRCLAHARGIAAALPARAPKKPKPMRRGVAFWIERPDGAVLLRRRKEAGLLGGMMEVPSTDWREGRADGGDAALQSPIPARFRPLGGAVRHEFTHFKLELSVLLGRAGAATEAPKGALWCPVDRLGDHALPTVMKKIARRALDSRG